MRSAKDVMEDAGVVVEDFTSGQANKILYLYISG